ncbi:MAG: ASCH domain-containing protein [Candidatus Marsarchaeota archaeon]|nr:ASCH domain-containing protein [Candidatus Marsarchaeota archaeon]
MATEKRKGKCISLKQPFAELVVSGKKKIELRPWNTNYRGWVYIHASKNPDIEACKRFGFDHKSMVNGAVVGRAHIYGVKRYFTKKGFMTDKHRHLDERGGFFKEGVYGFTLKDAERLKEPVSTNGQLNIFDAEF